MKNILELTFGFSDAGNYRRRENKDLFNRVFIRNSNLDKLCDYAVSFLVGEKGTGKTAYAVYLSNNLYKDDKGKDNQASLRYIRETDYLKFVALKLEKKLVLSDYASIWKVIILLLMSQQIQERENGLLQRFTKLKAVQEAIEEYYNKAFSPEIVHAFEFVQKSEESAKLIAKHLHVGGETTEEQTFSGSGFQTNLLYIQRQFELALNQVRLNTNHILFIDGIDIRPESVEYSEYLDCIKGLAQAVWELNNDFFPSIKGSKGRMRVVLLIRPDIFESLGFQNQNTKVRDNAVFLDWRTDYKNHRTSDLFKVADHLIASQQEEDTKLELGKAWDYYFPWSTPRKNKPSESDSSFIDFLRWSYHRPRDVVTMLVILQDLMKDRGGKNVYFTHADFDDSEFQRRYSDYLLGEVKDQLVFYYGVVQYELFLKFFEFLNGRNKFDYSEYIVAFKSFRDSIGLTDDQMPKFMTTPQAFLQFIYNLNIICYLEDPVEDHQYVHWCFRDRSFSNISPKVKEGVKYEIFYGLAKALNVGQRFRT